MEHHSDAEDRLWESQCCLPTTVRSRSAVSKLRSMPPDAQNFCIVKYAQRNLPHLLRCALTADISPDARWGNQDAPVLCVAAERGSERALVALLVGHANVSLVDRKGWTAAHFASSKGHTSCLRLLLDAGTPKEAKDELGFTPLLLAADAGHAECCSLLLAAGCDLDARNNEKATPLHCAAFKGRLVVVRQLLDAGANPHAVDFVGNVPLMDAISNMHISCAQALLPVTDVSIVNRQGLSIFHSTVMAGNMECFELLLPLVSDVNVCTVQGIKPDGSPEPVFNLTPLHLACLFGQHEKTKALLRHGAARTARDCAMQTPLHHAAQAGHLSCVALLLGKPGRYKLTPDEVNAPDVDGCTPLHRAAFCGHAQICGTLLAAGARPDAFMTAGCTPLMCAEHFHPANTALIDLLAGRGPAHPPGTVCDGCGRPETEVQLSSCDGCLVARFCGRACLMAIWPAHKAECRRLQAAREARTTVTFPLPGGSYAA